MNDRTTRFGTFTCTHCSKHWIKAIATLPATLPPSTTALPPSSPFPAKTCVHPIQEEGGQLRYTLRKLSLQCSKSSLRSVTWLRTPAITGNPRIRSNPEPVQPSTPYFPNYSVCSGEGAYIKTFVQDWSSGFGSRYRSIGFDPSSPPQYCSNDEITKWWIGFELMVEWLLWNAYKWFIKMVRVI